MTQDGLESKREQLEELEKSEREAKRLEAALGRGRLNGNVPRPAQGDEAVNGQTAENEESAPEEPSTQLPPHPGPIPPRRRSKAPGMGLLSALSYTLHGMMDVDPETARRNSITKTRESISQVVFFHEWLTLQTRLIRSTA
jgi:sorting nexin-41/42